MNWELTTRRDGDEDDDDGRIVLVVKIAAVTDDHAGQLTLVDC